jgi:hypothetical protein
MLEGDNPSFWHEFIRFTFFYETDLNILS